MRDNPGKIVNFPISKNRDGTGCPEYLDEEKFKKKMKE
jgi:hypothetical protein